MKSDFVSSFGIAFQVFKSLADEVRNLGGTDEDLRKIETVRYLRQSIAKQIVNTHYFKSGYYRIFASTDQGLMPDGSVLVRNHGCNGDRHVDQLIKEYRDTDGRVEYAEVGSREEVGLCDKLCDPRKIGFFAV